MKRAEHLQLSLRRDAEQWLPLQNVFQDRYGKFGTSQSSFISEGLHVQQLGLFPLPSQPSDGN